MNDAKMLTWQGEEVDLSDASAHEAHDRTVASRDDLLQFNVDLEPQKGLVFTKSKLWQLRTT
jgi:hypothetical protein